MKTKAIVIMVLVLCMLLSSPVFAEVTHTFDNTGNWSNKGSWDGGQGGKVPDADTDIVKIEVVGTFDLAAETITELHMDTGVAAGTLTVGSGTTLTVLDYVVLGAAGIGSKLNITGGTVVVGGAGSSYAVAFPQNGSSTTTQINVTDGVLKLYAGDDTSTEHNKLYRYVINFASDGGSIASIINVSGTGVMEFHPTGGFIPAIDHQDNSAGPITVDGDGYIVYVGCDAMDMIDEDADDHGGVFKGTTPPTPQKFTPADVTTAAMAYDQDTDDGIAWYYDGADTYLFPCKSPDGMTQIDAGDGGSRSVNEGATGITMDCTLDTASDDTGTYTFAWVKTSGPAVTFQGGISNVEDPNILFETSGVYTLKVTATRTPTGYDDPAIVDWVTYSIDYTRAKIMVTHLAIDAGELKAAIDNNWANFPKDEAEYFKDSSLEGNPENHHMVTYTGHDDWDDIQGVVGCGDNDAIGSDDDGSIVLYLNRHVTGFNEGAAHLDNIDTAITVALWYKGEDDKSQVLIEKEDTFSFELDRNDDKIQITIDMQDETDWRFTSKLRDHVGGLSDAGLSFRDDSGDEENWHHMAFSYDSANGVGKIYVDGVMIKDDNTTPGKLIATYPSDEYHYLHLGGIGSADDLRRGGLDDIRIYNYVLEDHEIAELAAMGESVAMLNAGSSKTVNPNEFPIQLDGKYIKLGRGSDTISDGNGNSDNPDERIAWRMRYGTGTATFSNRSDPRSTVTFSTPGIKTLRLTAYERFCGSSNDHYDNVNITVLDPTDCAGYLALGGDIEDFDDDCDVDGDDLKTLIDNWLDVSYP